MPTPRDSFSTSVVNGKIYAIGGLQVLALWPVLPTVEEYDPTTDTWTRKADMPTARTAFSTSAVNGKIYAAGGGATAILPGGGGVPAISIVEEYDTGFTPPKSVDARGKSLAVWGEIKSD